MTRLPDHLILENILPRLPVRSLFRFKSVCKDWLYAISRHDFAKSHLRYSSHRPHNFLLLANDSERYNYVFNLLSYDEIQHDLKPVILPLDIDNNGVGGVIDIVGSCDGLVCLYRELNQHRTFYLWNPAIRQSQEIDQIVELEEIEPFMFTAAYGFGHGSYTDDYKIIAIFTSYNNDLNTHLYVYSSLSGKWRRIACVLDNCRVSTIGIHKGVLIDSTVYWPLRIRDQGNQENQENRIVGFNLRDEKFVVHPWMGWLLQESESNLPLFGIQGCLSLCRYIDNTCFDVWTLKDRNDWNSWEKLFYVNAGYVDFIHFSKNGKCLVHHLKELKVVDQGQDTNLGGHYDGHLWDVEDYTESFVWPF
ncbi:F-box/kelch-repeat protein At3g23880-like [Silene latifolia]|uniref:F-box/kelch-repeat protein At3g23880-like n=1 Tax=Silene latifolia TaxID=37657 RepID=UPI003D78824C